LSLTFSLCALKEIPKIIFEINQLTFFIHATKLTNNGTKSNLSREVKYCVVVFSSIGHNGYVYGKLRVCVRGFSEGKSEASKQSN